MQYRGHFNCSTSPRPFFEVNSAASPMCISCTAKQCDRIVEARARPQSTSKHQSIKTTAGELILVTLCVCGATLQGLHIPIEASTNPPMSFRARQHSSSTHCSSAAGAAHPASSSDLTTGVSASRACAYLPWSNSTLHRPAGHHLATPSAAALD